MNKTPLLAAWIRVNQPFVFGNGCIQLPLLTIDPYQYIVKEEIERSNKLVI